MALLTRIAQTRQGAERLVDSRLFPVLTQCEFIDAKPEADRNILGELTLLPRFYHSLCARCFEFPAKRPSSLPSAPFAGAPAHRQRPCNPWLLLQAGIQAGALPNQSDLLTLIYRQAFDFLIAHRETITILLKDNSSEISLASFQDRQLLVSICSYVFPSIERTKLVGTSCDSRLRRIGAVSDGDNILTGPCGFWTDPCCGSKYWCTLLGPFTLAPDAATFERCRTGGSGYYCWYARVACQIIHVSHSKILDVGGRHVTKFDVMVQTSLKSLKYWVINYLSTSSNSMGKFC